MFVGVGARLVLEPEEDAEVLDAEVAALEFVTEVPLGELDVGAGAAEQ